MGSEKAPSGRDVEYLAKQVKPAKKPRRKKTDTRKSYALPIRSLRAGEKPPGGEPGRYKNSSGYIRLRWRGEGELIECYEHRWVMQCFDPDLHVHHINGNKDDNRPENLEIIDPSSHAKHHGATKVPDEELRRLYESGLSTPQVGAEVGLNPATVFRRLRRMGVRTRTVSETTVRLGVDLEAVRLLHDCGVTNRRIAFVLGVSPSVIDARAREMGLKPRRDGRPTDAEIAAAEAAIAEFHLRRAA